MAAAAMRTGSSPAMIERMLLRNPLHDEDDDDKGEGTSAAGAAIASLNSKHLSISDLLKTPLVFVNPRLPDDGQFKIPYEPLPTGPARPQAAAQSTATNGLTKPAISNGISAPARDPDLASSSPPSRPPSPKGKAPAIQSDSAIHFSMSWPQKYPAGPGYHNLGNTCFLNSTLQALTHTAPLVACLLGDTFHSAAKCRLPQNQRVCTLCQMQKHVRTCFGSRQQRGAIEPANIVRILSYIAKHMRVGRQEDAHEFLRFFLDKMQDAAAASMQPPAKTEAEKEKTFLYRIFGGKLRSRVSCSSCHHDSDTIDNIMDLSLDVSHAASVKEALQAFIKIDMLQGNNKYKCEKCKKLVNARKQFTIKQAPQILHIHLKRFTPTGKKITGMVQYPQELDLSPYMSEDAVEKQPRYRLYAVVCHAGGGPHSGHYFAFVRAADGSWNNMNDSSVTRSAHSPPLGARNAYLLFYERANRLDQALGMFKQPAGGQAVAASVSNAHANGQMANGKRKDREDEQEQSPFPAQKLKLHLPGQAGKPSRPNSPTKQHSSPSAGSPKFGMNGQARGPPYALAQSKQMSYSSSASVRPGGFYSQGRPQHGKNRHSDTMIGLMKGRPR